MEQMKTSKKSWKKISKERISKEMYFGREYTQSQLKKQKMENELYSMKSLVKKWELKDLERVHSVLKEKGKIDPDVFSRKCSQIIFPLLDKWWIQKDFNEICGILSQVVEKMMSEESSEYGLWK